MQATSSSSSRLPHSLCAGIQGDTNTLRGQAPSSTRVSSHLWHVWAGRCFVQQGFQAPSACPMPTLTDRVPRCFQMFAGDGGMGMEQARSAPAPRAARGGGRKHTVQHLSNVRAGSVHYKATYFSPSLTFPSRALLGAKCFSQARGDALLALWLWHAEAAVCSPRGGGGCSPGLGRAGA